MTRRIAAAAALFCGLLLAGCATPQRADPLEAMNRRVFAFNDALDEAVLAPVARGYARVVSAPVRHGVGNVFANPLDVGSAINLFLQGRPIDGLSDLARFGINSTVGVFGIFDPATPWGMPRHGEDFGQTLGRWGVGPGAYVVWPLLGPSALRDSLAMPVDYVTSPRFELAATPLQITQARSSLLSASSVLDAVALDRYLFVRDFYLQRRQSLVHDGHPPASTSANADAGSFSSSNPQVPKDE